MDAFLRRVVFSAGPHACDWADVVLAAALRGEWVAFETEVRQGLACSRRAAERRTPAGPDAVEAAAAEFRYARDLVTADEMEAWLEARGVTAAAWMACIERAVLRRAWADDLGAIVAAHPVTDAEVADVVVAEGFTSGAFARFAETLAGRIAACGPSREGAEAPPAPAPPGLGSSGLPGLAADGRQERLRWLARLEADFQAHRATLLTDEAIHRAIGVHRLDWIRLDCAVLAFDDEQAAREAALAVRDDGLSPAAVAVAARVGLEELAVYLADVEPGLRDHLLGARAGDVVGPLVREDGFTLLHVRAKRLPAPDDPEVRRRAEAAVVQSRVSAAVTDHVRWQHAL